MHAFSYSEHNMPPSTVQNEYSTQGLPLVTAPEIFQLRKNKLGLEALGIMRGRYKGCELVDLLGSEQGSITMLKEGEVMNIGGSFYRRFAIGPIVRELVPDAQLLSPAFSELAYKDRESVFQEDHTLYSVCAGENLGIVVFTDSPNNHLLNQARERGIPVEFPLVFYHLKTVKDSAFPHGLRFDMDDIGVAYPVPILREKRKVGFEDAIYFFADDPELIRTGFPSKLYTHTESHLNSEIRGKHRGVKIRSFYGSSDSHQETMGFYRTGDKLGLMGDLSQRVHPVRDPLIVSFVRGHDLEKLEKMIESGVTAIELERLRQIDALNNRAKRAMDMMEG